MPLEQAAGVSPGRRYTVFSDEELAEIRERLAWLVAAEKSFDFWNSPADGHLRHAVTAATSFAAGFRSPISVPANDAELQREREGETAVEDVASGAADRQLPDAVPRILDEDQGA